MLATPWLKRIDLLTGELTALTLSPTERFMTDVVDGATAFIEHDGSGCWYHHARGAKLWLLHGTALAFASSVFVFMEHPEARHPELEAALSTNDAGAVAVYADWLEEQGDPFAGVLNPALLAARGPAGLWFLEGLERNREVTATLRDGLVRELEVRVPGEQLVSTLHRLAHLRAGVALERLSVDYRSLWGNQRAPRDGALFGWPRVFANRVWDDCRWPLTLRELRFNGPRDTTPEQADLTAFEARLRRRLPRLTVRVE